MKCRIRNRIAGIFTVSLLFCLTVGVNQAFCQDFFMGKVVAVNTKEKKVEVAPILTQKELGAGIQSGNVLVQSKLSLPACVTVGASIRLWGERLPGDVNTFIATDIRGCRGGGCSDPTGVRSRLSRKGKNHRSKWSDADQIDLSNDGNGAASGSGRGANGGNGNGGGGGGGGGGGR